LAISALLADHDGVTIEVEKVSDGNAGSR